MKNKNKTITFRLSEREYERCLNIAIKKSNMENRIVKISEVIRESINKGLGYVE